MPTSSLDPTYGAIFIGLLFATFFQGVLSVQAFVYYENFPNDRWKTKLLVAGVWCIDLLHLILIAQATYHYLVTNWGNPIALAFSTWELDSHLVLLGVASIMCQSFFLNRVWLFSGKNKLLLAALTLPCLVTLGLDVSMSIQIMQAPSVSSFQALTAEVIAVFSIGAAIDVIIALMLCYYLLRGRSGFEKTNSIVAKLVRYTVTTGLATSLLAVACLVAYFAAPHTFIYIAMHFSLGRMYTNALLATLNSRRSLRAELYKTEMDSEPCIRSFKIATYASGGRSVAGAYRLENSLQVLDGTSPSWAPEFDTVDNRHSSIGATDLDIP